MSTAKGQVADLQQEKMEFLRTIRATEVDRPDAPAAYWAFVEYLEKSCTRPAHYVRYCQTFLSLAPFLEHVSGGTLVETGGFCDISLFLRTQGFDCRRTNGDLRYAIDLRDAAADIVLSLEVIEHIKDQAEDTIDDIVLFRETGVRQYVKEMQRVLKPGGILILTTPNPCSIRALEQLVSHKPPMVFRPHVREYSRDELLQLFAAMDVLEAKTHFSFFHLARRNRNRWVELLERNGWDSSHRGDDHFMVFRKREVGRSRGTIGVTEEGP